MKIGWTHFGWMEMLIQTWSHAWRVENEGTMRRGSWEKLRPPSLALESIPSRPNGELTVETKFDVIKYPASSLEPIWGSTFEKTKALGLASEVVPDVEIKLDGHTHKKHKKLLSLSSVVMVMKL